MTFKKLPGQRVPAPEMGTHGWYWYRDHPDDKWIPLKVVHTSGWGVHVENDPDRPILSYKGEWRVCKYPRSKENKATSGSPLIASGWQVIPGRRVPHPSVTTWYWYRKQATDEWQPLCVVVTPQWGPHLEEKPNDLLADMKGEWKKMTFPK